MDFVFLDFINSRWEITHKPYSDPLDNREWIVGFIKKWYPDIGIPGEEPDPEELRKLRSVLAEAIVDIRDKESISTEHAGEINKYLSASDFRFGFEKTASGGRMLLKPVNSSWDGVLSRIAHSFAEFVAENDKGRVKQCANDECKWVFHDESKSRTRKWCCNTCASLMKVRRHRQKEKNS